MLVLGVRHHVMRLSTDTKDFERGTGRPAHRADVAEQLPHFIEFVRSRRATLLTLRVLFQIEHRPKGALAPAMRADNKQAVVVRVVLSLEPRPVALTAGQLGRRNGELLHGHRVTR